MKTIILAILITTTIVAQNMITGALEYQQKPDDITNNTDVVNYKQKVSARLSAVYKIKGVDISSTSLINLNDFREIMVLFNFTVPLP